MAITKWCLCGLALGLLAIVIFAACRSPYPRSVRFSAPHLGLGARLIERYWFTPIPNETIKPIINKLFPTVYACPKPSCEAEKMHRINTGDTCTGTTYYRLYPGRAGCPSASCEVTAEHKICTLSYNQDKYYGCYLCRWAYDKKCH